MHEPKKEICQIVNDFSREQIFLTVYYAHSKYINPIGFNFKQ